MFGRQIYGVRETTKEDVMDILAYLLRHMPDLKLSLDKIQRAGKTFPAITIPASQMDKETSQILTGLVFKKCSELGLVNRDGSANIDTASKKVKKDKLVVLFFHH